MALLLELLSKYRTELFDNQMAYLQVVDALLYTLQRDNVFAGRLVQ